MAIIRPSNSQTVRCSCFMERVTIWTTSNKSSPKRFTHNERAVNIHHYLEVTVSFTSDLTRMDTSWTLAHVSWFQPHPSRYDIGKPVELWCHNLYESHGVSSYLPSDLLLCRCAFGTYQLNRESLLLSVPLV